MGSCEKCWDHYCTCGYQYRDWTVERLNQHIQMLWNVMWEKLMEREKKSAETKELS